MPRLYYTSRLRAVAPPDGLVTRGQTVGAALTMAFAVAPLLRSYVLDETGQLRRELEIEVDGRTVPAAEALRHPVNAASDIYVAAARRPEKPNPGGNKPV